MPVLLCVFIFFILLFSLCVCNLIYIYMDVLVVVGFLLSGVPSILFVLFLNDGL